MSYPPSTRDTDAEPEPPRTLNEYLRDVRDAAQFADGLRSELAALSASFDDDIIFRSAQAVFEADVARRGDMKNHVALRRLRQADRAVEQRDRTLQFARDKHEFNAAEAVLKKLAEIKAIDADRALPHRDKIDAVRRHLFGEQPPDLDDATTTAFSEDEPA